MSADYSSASSASFSLMDLTSQDMTAVNDLILARAGSDVEMIPQMAGHLISSGGKRLRPMLTLASARMFDYQGQHHITLATAVEFMHTATLLHDDVVDESALRRGQPTARMIWGNQASVLVGDFLLGQAFKMMVEVGSMPALAVLSNAASVIAEGEVMQLAAAKHIATGEDDYLAIINAKTAALFSAAAEVGPIIAEAGPQACMALRHYGTNLGLAFQLVDDALDYGGSTNALGKNTGDDFREGKITMPVILSYARSTPQQRTFWQQAMEEAANDTAAFDEAIALLHQHGALEATIARARQFGDKARQALDSMPQNAQKQALLDVVDFCISRVT